MSCLLLGHCIYTLDIICCRVWIGSPSALILSEGKGTVVSSGSVSSQQSPSLAIDGTSSSCSSVTGTGKAWLLVDIQAVRFIREVSLLFLEGSGAGATILVGRSLRNKGVSNYEKCGNVSNSASSSIWKNVTCSQAVLGQFIYIESRINSMQLCEIEVFHGNGKPSYSTAALGCFDDLSASYFFIDNILNIYSPVHVKASNEKEGFCSIWKPIDGVIGITVEESWAPLSSSLSWWRMELPRRSAISRVTVYIPAFEQKDILKRLAMHGFAVYIGDKTIGNGSKNAMCGKPWVVNLSSVIIFNCQHGLAGKYLYVAASDQDKAALYLTEIEVYGCEGSCIYGKLHEVQITISVIPLMY